MARARFVFMDKDEEQLVHDESLRCLREIGVMIKSPHVLEMLERAGATVDKKKGVAKLPEDMVESAIKSAPKEYTIGARDPKHERTVPVKTTPLMATTGLAVYTLDLETQERRPTTSKDLANFSRLADALDPVEICWTSVTAGDVDQEMLAPLSLWTALRNCTKHVHVVPVMRDGEDAKLQVELASLAAGGKDKLRRKPLFSAICCPVAPLTFERGAVEGQVELAKAGIPIVCMSMSLCGMSSPVTVPGTVVNVNAENLASLTIQQTAAKGSPFIYSTESAPIDMMTGVMDYTAYEMPLISAGAAQMARRYGLSSMTGNWGVEGRDPGILASFSEAITTVFASMDGTDMCSGAGSFDSAKGAALEQVVIDAYLWDDIRHYMRSYDFTKDTMALDIVKEVGHGNTFLKHLHTARNFRKEIMIRDKQRRHWQATLSTSMAPEAREIAKKLLKEHSVPDLDRDLVRKGEELLKAYSRKLSR